MPYQPGITGLNEDAGTAGVKHGSAGHPTPKATAVPGESWLACLPPAGGRCYKIGLPLRPNGTWVMDDTCSHHIEIGLTARLHGSGSGTNVVKTRIHQPPGRSLTLISPGWADQRCMGNICLHRAAEHASWHSLDTQLCCLRYHHCGVTIFRTFLIDPESRPLTFGGAITVDRLMEVFKPSYRRTLVALSFLSLTTEVGGTSFKFAVPKVEPQLPSVSSAATGTTVMGWRCPR